MKGVSIIICCYNSSTRIPETLRHLAGLNIPPTIDCEIIIVNNVSIDDTVHVAKREWKKYDARHFSFKIVNESQLGLSHARLRGITEAKYEYLLFCDDDNWLQKDYVTIGFSILEQNAFIGVLGGVGKPVFGGVKPDWFDKYSMYYAVGKQSVTIGDISNSRGWLYGAGFFIRRMALNDISKHSFITSDRKGASLSSGGDIELCYLILINGYKIWYDENLTFDHYIEANRLEIKYIQKMMMSHAKEAYRLDGLAYRSKAQSQLNWYTRKFQRVWFSRFLIDAINLKRAFSYREFPNSFLFKLHITRLIAILKLNSRFDKSFYQ